MFDHISIGVTDLEKARTFYDAVLRPLGYSCLTSGEDTLGYGKSAVQLWINVAGNPVPADKDSGLHFCFTAPTAKSVDAFYKAALSAGGTDNGSPGIRANYDENYYAAFAIDPDGYRLEAYCGKPG